MKNCRQFFLLLSLVVNASSVQAAWSLNPSYYFQVAHNDNIYLLPKDSELAVTGVTFSPLIKSVLEEKDQSLIADVGLQLTRYKDHEELDRKEGNVGLSWSQSTELSLYGIDASYTRKSNLDPTLEISGIDQKVEQNSTNISPNWRYQIAERWSLSIDLSHADVEFDEPGRPGIYGFKVVNFINYTDNGVNLTLTRSLSEQDNLSMTYYQSRYEGISNGLQYSNTYPIFPGVYFIEASERKLEYDYQVMRFGYHHQFNEAQSLNLQIGTSETNIQNLTRLHLFDQAGLEILPSGDWTASESNQKGQVYNFIYNQMSESSQLEMSVSRNRVASSRGGLDETDTAKIFYASNITERLSWTMDVNDEKHRPDQDTSVQSVIAYTRINVSPALHYMIDKDWSMSLGYIYSEKDIRIDEQPSESSKVFFTMSWREPKLFSSN